MDWNIVIKIVGEIILIVLSYAVIPWIKAKINAEKLERYMTYAEIAVGAAEQMAENSGADGTWKKNFVTEYLVTKCGMTDVDVDTLNNIIENAVIMLHNELGKTE